MLFTDFELGVMKVGKGVGREGCIEGVGAEIKRKKALGVITSCQFQFQKQIPPTCQQPSTNSHCQNEHLSKVVSFEKGFYDTNKTLKLLTADECSLGKKKVLTIYGHLNSHSYLGKSQTKVERKKQVFEPILSQSPIKKTSQDSRFKPDGCRSETGWNQGRPPNVV